MLRAFGDDLENLGVQRDDFGRHMSAALVDLPRYFDKQRRRHDVGQDREVGLVIGGLQSAKLQLRLLQEGLGIESRRQRSYRRRGATIECRLDTRCARCGREFRHRDATGGGRLGHRTRHEKSAHQHDRADHALLAGKGAGLTQIAKPQVRPYVFKVIGAKFPKLQILESGKGAVLISEMDLTCGLLGNKTMGITGYDAAYAHAFVRNAILWAINGRGPVTAWATTQASTP